MAARQARRVPSYRFHKASGQATQVRHFGKGQTQAEIDLEPGTYTLQLVLGNHLHIPHKPPVTSGTIRITVE